MSKARLVITAIEVEGRTPAEVVAAYRVSRSRLYELLKRYRAEGDAAFEPRSRRPRTAPRSPPASHRRTGAPAAQAADRVGPGRRGHHRQAPAPPPQHHPVAGHDPPAPGPARRRRPRPGQAAEVLLRPVRRRAAERDLAVRFHDYRPTRSDGRPGADTEIDTWLDDHSRLALRVSAHPRITAPIVVASLTQAAAQHGYPASTLTDNGTVYTTRFAGGRGGRNHLEHELARLGIVQKNSRPEHPTTCGKVERFSRR